MRWILTGLLGSILVAAASIATFFIWQWQTRAPLASLLPAERTIAFFPRTTGVILRETFLPWVPEVRDVPAEGWMSLAIVEKPSGGTAWVIAPTEFTNAGDSPAEIRLRGKTVYISDGTTPDDIGIREGETPLSSSPSFLALTSETVTQDWGYVRTLPGGDADPRLLQIIGQSADGAVFERRGEKDFILRYRVSNISGTPVRFAFPDTVPPGTQCLGQATPELLLRQLVPDGDPLLTQSIRQRQIEKLLGADVSMQFDILPLLKRPAVACIRDVGGRRSVLLIGETENATAWEKITARLHDSFHDRASRGYVDRRTVEEKYAYAIVKDATTDLHTESRMENGWSTTVTPLTASGGLFTARLRNRFVLATSPELFASGLSPVLRPLDGVSAGTMDFGSLTPLALPPLLSPVRSLLPQQARLTWTFEIADDLGRLSIHLD